jgi:hypothetical protein
LREEPTWAVSGIGWPISDNIFLCFQQVSETKEKKERQNILYERYTKLQAPSKDIANGIGIGIGNRIVEQT